MGVGRAVAGRLALLLPTALGVTILTFLLLKLIPGDPAAILLGSRATPEQVVELRAQLGLDRPLAEQYGAFLADLLRGDLGRSIFYRRPVLELVADRLPVTLWLVGYAVALASAISVLLAALAARRRDGAADHAVLVIPLVGLGMPSFWIALLLVEVFSLRLRLFPVATFGVGVLGHLHAMFLPALTIAVAMVPPLVRSLRVALLRIGESDFVTTARAKGLGEWTVLRDHGLRNALVSTVTVLGVNVAYLVGGTLVVEKVFGLPGLGSLMIDAIFNRDFPVVQGVTFVFAVLVVLVNLVTDVVHALLDPRVAYP